jgi:hypothetical protein
LLNAPDMKTLLLALLLTSSPEHTLQIMEPDPLDRAVRTLNTRHGWSISYEEDPALAAGYSKLDFRYSFTPTEGHAHHRILNELIASHAGRGEPWYRVRETQLGVVVTPASQSVLDQKVSVRFSAPRLPLGQALTELGETIARTTGRRVLLADTRFKGPTIEVKAEEGRVARDVLAKLLSAGGARHTYFLQWLPELQGYALLIDPSGSAEL